MPEDVADVHSEFVEAARASVDRVAEIVLEVERGELSCGRQLNGELYGMESTSRAETALRELASRGYVVFGN